MNPKAKSVHQDFFTLWKDADPDLTYLTAQTISHYRIIEKLGGGRMVYKAEDTRLHRFRAKFLQLLPSVLTNVLCGPNILDQWPPLLNSSARR